MRLPSCGQRIVDFIANFGRIKIEAAGDIKVNGTVWKRAVRQRAGTLAAGRDDLLEGFIVQVNFWRNGAHANGP